MVVKAYGGDEEQTKPAKVPVEVQTDLQMFDDQHQLTSPTLDAKIDF